MKFVFPHELLLSAFLIGLVVSSVAAQNPPRFPEQVPAPPPSIPSAPTFTPNPALPSPELRGPQGEAAKAENPNNAPIVTAIKIVGNKNASEIKIRSKLKTRTGRPFDPTVVQADVRTLTQSGNFRDVKTFTQPYDNGLAVTFEVFERPAINYVKFVGNRSVKDKTLLKQSDLKIGDALNQFTIEEGRRKVEEYYHSKGYPKTTLEILEGNQPTDTGVVFIVNEGKLQRISKVEFEGNEIASDGRLKTQVQSKPGFLWYTFGGKVERKKIEEDIERLTAYYRSLGYFQARVSRELIFDEADEWLTLKYVIFEGRRSVVRSISVVGNEKFTSDFLMDKFEMKFGEYFNQSKMNRDNGTLKDEYGSQGHIFADIQGEVKYDLEAGEVDIVYTIKEGDVFRVGKVNIVVEGEYPHTRHSTIVNRLSIKPGDIIDIRKIRESESRLKASQLFQNDQSKGNPPQVVVVPPDGMGEAVAQKSNSKSGSRGAGRPRTQRGQSPDEDRPWSFLPQRGK